MTVGEDFVLAEWTQQGSPPGERMLVAPYHIHRHCDEAWYILEGTLCVQVGDDVVTATAGDSVLVPRGVRHAYWNPSSDQVRYMLVMTRKTYELIQAIHSAEDRSYEAMVALFDRFDAVYLGFQAPS